MGAQSSWLVGCGARRVWTCKVSDICEAGKRCVGLPVVEIAVIRRHWLD